VVFTVWKAGEGIVPTEPERLVGGREFAGVSRQLHDREIERDWLHSLGAGHERCYQPGLARNGRTRLVTALGALLARTPNSAG